MIYRNAVCDICGKDIGSGGGGHIDLHSHDAVRMVLPTYPAKYPGLYDICDECRDSLSAWVRKRMEEVGK